MFTLSSYNHVYCLWILITNNYIYQENQIILNEIRWNKQWKGEKEPLASYSIINCFVKAYVVLDKLKFIEWLSNDSYPQHFHVCILRYDLHFKTNKNKIKNIQNM